MNDLLPAKFTQMTSESQDFTSLRDGEYARAAKDAGKFHVEPDQPTRAECDREAEEDAWPWCGSVFVCRACGQRKRIRPQMHVCMECFYELEGER
jgi:hypothetical protein